MLLVQYNRYMDTYDKRGKKVTHLKSVGRKAGDPMTKAQGMAQKKASRAFLDKLFAGDPEATKRFNEMGKKPQKFDKFNKELKRVKTKGSGSRSTPKFAGAKSSTGRAASAGFRGGKGFKNLYK
tara:strand:- start:261 stop:632 length:372 start_codon:yes stop_codon:yes gene_type:complete